MPLNALRCAGQACRTKTCLAPAPTVPREDARMCGKALDT